eukprot:gb/GEZN01009444.1/.p1 GENE.gb/GEZN01009444.1/~~gb/GEZN01009444.1/.p1  ORF type:complete len:404 (+),score=14.95 gb/GEZN01009444.1/:43-1254(+)
MATSEFLYPHYLVIFCFSIAWTTMSTAFPYMSRALTNDHIGVGYATVASAYWLAKTCSSSYLGSLSDRLGRRIVMLGLLAGHFLAFVCCGTARTLVQLGLAHLFMGVFAAVSIVSLAWIRDNEPNAAIRAGIISRIRALWAFSSFVAFVVLRIFGNNEWPLTSVPWFCALVMIPAFLVLLCMGTFPKPSPVPESPTHKQEQVLSFWESIQVLWRNHPALLLSVACGNCITPQALLAMILSLDHFNNTKMVCSLFGLALAASPLVALLARGFGTRDIAIFGARAEGCMYLLAATLALSGTLEILPLFLVFLVHKMVVATCHPCMVSYLQALTPADAQGTFGGVNGSLKGISMSFATFLCSSLLPIHQSLPFFFFAIAAFTQAAICASLPVPKTVLVETHIDQSQ